MKRSIYLLLIFMMTVSLYGCGSKAENAETAAETIEETQTHEELQILEEPQILEETETVTVEGKDPLGILPQTIEKTITYQKDAATGEVLETIESCKSWK
ncbi:MAG: hypothetical protein IKY23_07910, partial [Lachnospiraceae bacterium]|nr:hypothetical protein [Lachnospiraceae bacterium]